ncbi:MAG: hypothetical protein PUF45_06710 [Lachnospiraceae bacterium]|nr:hypothetical protein [Lachnospiraceae bacterium]
MKQKKDVQQMYDRLMEYERQQHESNQKKIKVGIRLLWIIPLIFLALLFITDSSKPIFLVLWIVSLFVIAVYLIMVEYADYNLQEKMNEINGNRDGFDSLLDFDDVEERVIAATERLDGWKERKGEEK